MLSRSSDAAERFQHKAFFGARARTRVAVASRFMQRAFDKWEWICAAWRMRRVMGFRFLGVWEGCVRSLVKCWKVGQENSEDEFGVRSDFDSWKW